MLVLLLGRGQLLAAVLADVAGIPRSALPGVHLEAQEGPLGPALLCWGASLFEGIGEPLELSLMLALADLPVCSRIESPIKTSLAPAAHEDAGVKVRVHFMAPLMLARLLGRAPRPLPASVGRASESAGSRARYLHQADLLVQVAGFRKRGLPPRSRSRAADRNHASPGSRRRAAASQEAGMGQCLR